MKVNISDLTRDQFIYPRAGKSDKTISAYVEALEIGAQFPPIKIQRVFNYADGNETTEATIILDGIPGRLLLRKRGSKRLRQLNGRTNPLITRKIK